MLAEYQILEQVLHRAYDQAANGKGKERHACDRPFEEQPMQTISQLLGSHTGLLYQAMKKIQESQRMDKDAAVRELLGAINYIAGAVIFIEGKKENPDAPDWVCKPCGKTVPVGEACPSCFAIT